MVTVVRTFGAFVLLFAATSCALLADIREPILDENVVDGPVMGGAGCENEAIAQISAGAGYGCARFPNGKLKCWGDDWDGKLGLGGSYVGEIGANLPVINLGSNTSAIHVEAGTHHTCAILTGGRLKCWGNNEGGQLGLGDQKARGLVPEDMGDNLPDINLGDKKVVTQVALGDAHTCALLSDESVKCWGANSSGVLGTGNLDDIGTKLAHLGESMPTVDLGGGGTVKAIAITAGQAHNCALLESGDVKCWGSNIRSQLGISAGTSVGASPGQMGDALPTVDLGASFKVSALVAGRDFNCALSTTHFVKCWGDNASGQLGQGDTDMRGIYATSMGDNLKPVDVGPGRTVNAISAGAKHACALLDDSTVRCWGDSTKGQLGLGDDFTQGDEAGEMGQWLSPVELGADQKVKAIDCGAFQNCVLRVDGSAKCWGFNESYALGLGDLGPEQFGSPRHLGDDTGEMGDALPKLLLCAP